MVPSLYKLLVYLRVGPEQLALVEQFVDEDEAVAFAEGRRRILNNPKYVCVVIQYNADSAIIVT